MSTVCQKCGQACLCLSTVSEFIERQQVHKVQQFQNAKNLPGNPTDSSNLAKVESGKILLSELLKQPLTQHTVNVFIYFYVSVWFRE